MGKPIYPRSQSLIAAAPDLLEALKECLGYVKSDYEGSGGRDLSGGTIGR